MFFFFSTLAFSAIAPCPNISTVLNLNLTEYIRKPWYIQMQQETPYLPEETNYCVTAQYSISTKKILFYNNTVLNVYNNARFDNISGPELNFNNNSLCARINGMNSKLLVAPCFLPNLFAGDYWVISVGPSSKDYQFAIVSGGQPNIRYSNGCSTSTTTINDSGLWILTRNQTVSEVMLESLKASLISLGITTELLNTVQQKGCIYKYH